MPEIKQTSFLAGAINDPRSNNPQRGLSRMILLEQYLFFGKRLLKNKINRNLLLCLGSRRLKLG